MADRAAVTSVVVAKPASGERRIPELDGVRAVAIWMVLLSHLFFAYAPPPGAMAWMPSTVRTAIAHGWLGVDLFFVLSGFLITGILLDSRDDPKFFRNFYGRRALRILPVYLASVLVMGLLYVHGRAYLLLSAIFMGNMAGLLAISVPHGAGVLWSLAVEEHFYLVWPCIVRFASRRTIAVVALVIVLSTPLLRAVAAVHGLSLPGIIYQVSIFRFDGLALGALVAIWYRSPRYSRTQPWQVIAALLALDAALTIAVFPFGGLHTSTTLAIAFRYTQAQLVFAAGILAALAYRNTSATAILRSWGAILTGELSYCIYLIHLALIDAYMAVGARRIEPLLIHWKGPDYALAVRILIMVAAIFGLALLSRSYLERPFLRLKRRFA